MSIKRNIKPALPVSETDEALVNTRHELARAASKLEAAGAVATVAPMLALAVSPDAAQALDASGIAALLIAGEKGRAAALAAVKAACQRAKDDPETGLELCRAAFCEAVEALTGRLPYSARELQGKTAKDEGGTADEAKVFGRIRSQFKRAGVDFAMPDGVVTARLILKAEELPAAPVLADEADDEADDTSASEQAAPIVATVADAAAVLAALGAAGALEALAAAGLSMVDVRAALNAGVHPTAVRPALAA